MTQWLSFVLFLQKLNMRFTLTPETTSELRVTQRRKIFLHPKGQPVPRAGSLSVDNHTSPIPVWKCGILKNHRSIFVLQTKISLRFATHHNERGGCSWLCARSLTGNRLLLGVKISKKADQPVLYLVLPFLPWVHLSHLCLGCHW